MFSTIDSNKLWRKEMEKSCSNCKHSLDNNHFGEICKYVLVCSNKSKWEPIESEIIQITEKQAREMLMQHLLPISVDKIINIWINDGYIKDGYIKPEITPCPCCNANVSYYTNNDSHVPYYSIECDCGICTTEFDSIDELLEVWNKRLE